MPPEGITLPLKTLFPLDIWSTLLSKIASSSKKSLALSFVITLEPLTNNFPIKSFSPSIV